MNNLNGGRPAINYLLTLDTATDIANISKGVIGNNIRKHLRDCKKLLKSPQAVAMLHNHYQMKSLKEMQLQLESANQKVKLLEERNEKLDPYLQYAKMAMTSNCDIMIREVAKLLYCKEFPIGEKGLYALLRDWGCY